MSPAELSNLLALVRDSRALGWTIRLGKTGRAIIRKPRGAPWFLDGLLQSYRGELAALMKAGILQPDPQARPGTDHPPRGRVSPPRVVWVQDHWEVRDVLTEAPRGPERGSP